MAGKNNIKGDKMKDEIESEDLNLESFMLNLDEGQAANVKANDCATCLAGTLAEIEEKEEKRTEHSGDGQKNAKKKRVKKLEEKLKRYINGDELKIDKNEFCRLLNAQFEGAEHILRDYKTRKAYQAKIEENNKVKIIWEKGTIIKELPQF